MLRTIVLLTTLLVSACGSFGDYKLDVGDQVRTQRGFFEYRGADTVLLSHTIAVGYPGGLNYVYDLGGGRLVGAWRGGFVDARGMWQGRGRGEFTALGEVRFLDREQALQSGDPVAEFRPRGYNIDAQSGAPQFHYSLGRLEASDSITPLEGRKGLLHSVQLSQLEDGLSYRLLSADSITRDDQGSFIIDDGQLSISDIRGATARIDSAGDRASLVLIVEQPVFSYSLSW